MGFFFVMRGATAFPIITLWLISVTMEIGVLIQSAPKPKCSLFTTPIMLQIKFDCNWPMVSVMFENVKVAISAGLNVAVFADISTLSCFH